MLYALIKPMKHMGLAVQQVILPVSGFWFLPITVWRDWDQVVPALLPDTGTVIKDNSHLVLPLQVLQGRANAFSTFCKASSVGH